MAKSASKHAAAADAQRKAGPLLGNADKNAFDPGLASLFASSLGPVKPPTKSRYENIPIRGRRPGDDSNEEQDDDEERGDSESEGSETDGPDRQDRDDGAVDSADEDESASEQAQSDSENVLARLRESVLHGEQDSSKKKRKRASKEEEVEDVYMRKLAREEVKEDERRAKKHKGESVEANGKTSDESDTGSGGPYTIPKHETQIEASDKTQEEIDKAARTVFLGNVSSEAITSKTAKKALLRHLGSFIDDLADSKSQHKVESLRFRSTAFASAIPKKAAFAKKEIMDATTKSTNAYAVYSTLLAAREAAKRLNGTVVLGRHLRVDSVAHPAKVDHRRCVFVGNLGFVDDESNIEDGEGKKKKNKPPGDSEEGLWVHFSKAGNVESVRVVRDAQTRVSKGIAYVQFEDENGVEAALQFNDQKFPPLLPRKLRVVRAKAPRKKQNAAVSKTNPSRANGVYNVKVSDEQKSKQGRARNMLGKAAAFKSAESFVFEGHRASSKQAGGLKLGGKKKGGKPQNRGSKRAAAWKKSGGKR